MVRSDNVMPVAHPGLHVRPWRRAHGVALIIPVAHGGPPSPSAVDRCVSILAEQGRWQAVTPALGRAEQAGFLAAGFTVQERLHLLTRNLSDRPGGGGSGGTEGRHRLRRAHRRDRAAVLDVDAAAFESFWQLDAEGLDEALAATPVSRFRVADAAATGGDQGSGLAGYAICGRAGKRGYVQRVAVDPVHQGAGLGRALVADGLSWMRRRGVAQAAVNTQESNHAALSLYERLGFCREPEGLAVLGLSLRRCSQ